MAFAAISKDHVDWVFIPGFVIQKGPASKIIPAGSVKVPGTDSICTKAVKLDSIVNIVNDAINELPSRPGPSEEVPEDFVLIVKDLLDKGSFTKKMSGLRLEYDASDNEARVEIVTQIIASRILG